MSDGIDITLDEANAIAHRMCAVLVANAVQDGLLDWELVPELSEVSWGRLVVAVDIVAADAQHRADALDRRLNVDSRTLMERAS